MSLQLNALAFVVGGFCIQTHGKGSDAVSSQVLANRLKKHNLILSMEAVWRTLIVTISELVRVTFSIKEIAILPSEA